MIRILLIAALLVLFSACSDSVEPIKVEKGEHTQKPYEQNAVDAVGVAEGDKQVSPNGRPAY
ncbi:hypothetical protein [Ghiorsea bivora]|uniref:hypothetical protein n=1 Tax=Ghiorsea bivora TaxID=1485545 RepID=UPI0005716A9C|nr:hypothetical protein [Ghiorsea bivora]